MKNAKQAILESDIQEALKKFQERGGLIKKLPDEVVPNHNMVGARWAVYETIQEASSGSTDAA